ncbi:MAG: hypothetical protein AAGD04_12850 [Pseudomonadota bacterium]
MSADLLKNNLMHSRAAYHHAVAALPLEEKLQTGTIRQYGFEFSRSDQITSQVIELGWAFFPRYEGCLEKWLKDQSVKLNRKVSLKVWLENNNVEIPDKYLGALESYRKIRNSLHHDDGASFDSSLGTEIHLMPTDMERFFDLFCWIGEQVEAVNVLR